MKRLAPAVKPPSVDALCAEHRNEESHARHVAALALQLFDAVQTTFNLRKRDRRLLETAARLHDIGYASRPDDHVAAGVEIVRASGLLGFSSRQVEDIASIMALHGKLPDAQAAELRIESAERPERIFQLGAILRIADALDQGHLQDTRISAVALEDGMIRVRVSAPRGSLGVERAMAKSDLWQRVFPLGIAFDARYRAPAAEPKADAPAGESIRRLMLTQYRVLRTSVRRAARDDEEALHDLRIAVRGLRRLLEAFERPLRKTSAAQVAEALRAFAKRLGPARDLDVWVGLLRRPRYREALAAAPEYVEAQEQERLRARDALRAELNDESVRKLLVSFGYLLRIELPHAAPRLDRPFGRLARRRIKDAWKQAMAKRRWAQSRRADTLHAFRIRLRKLRLLATLTAPALSPEAKFMIAAVHDLERNLGRIHDLDEALKRASRTGAPEALVSVLARRRRKELRRFRAAWKNFNDRKFQRRCREAWK
jgi:putative nucleotidyltransferase with HDIG domain